MPQDTATDIDTLSVHESLTVNGTISGATWVRRQYWTTPLTSMQNWFVGSVFYGKRSSDLEEFDVMPVAGTVKALRVVVANNDITNNATLTLFKNGAATELTVHFDGKTAYQEKITDVSFIAGDRLGFRVTEAGYPFHTNDFAILEVIL